MTDSEWNLDRAIDHVVRGMVSAESPVDLRQRVLARLEERAGHRGPWRMRPAWAMAAGLAAVLIGWTLWPSHDPGLRVARQESGAKPVAAPETSEPRPPVTSADATLSPPSSRGDATPQGGPGLPARDFAAVRARAERTRHVPSAAATPAEATVADAANPLEPSELAIAPLETPGAMTVEAMQVERLGLEGLSVSRLEIEHLEFSPLMESWQW